MRIWKRSTSLSLAAFTVVAVAVVVASIVVAVVVASIVVAVVVVSIVVAVVVVSAAVVAVVALAAEVVVSSGYRRCGAPNLKREVQMYRVSSDRESYHCLCLESPAVMAFPQNISLVSRLSWRFGIKTSQRFHVC